MTKSISDSSTRCNATREKSLKGEGETTLVLNSSDSQPFSVIPISPSTARRCANFYKMPIDRETMIATARETRKARMRLDRIPPSTVVRQERGSYRAERVTTVLRVRALRPIDNRFDPPSSIKRFRGGEERKRNK